MDSQPCLICKISWGVRFILGGRFIFLCLQFFRGGSEVVRVYFLLLPRKMASLSRPISSGISALVTGSSSVLPLVWRRLFLRDISCPSVPYDERRSKILGGNSVLYLGGSSPWLLFPSSYCGEGLNGLSIVPKVPKFLGGSLKFSKVLLRDCEQRTDKSEPILLFFSYHRHDQIGRASCLW